MCNDGTGTKLSDECVKVARILDACGRDIIIIETVGVGQSELDIAKVTDSVVVMLTPESGDGVQIMKTGLMELKHHVEAECTLLIWSQIDDAMRHVWEYRIDPQNAAREILSDGCADPQVNAGLAALRLWCRDCVLKDTAGGMKNGKSARQPGRRDRSN